MSIFEKYKETLEKKFNMTEKLVQSLEDNDIDIEKYIKSDMAKHFTVRIYSNGDKARNIVAHEDILTHIWYNSVMRFGCTLFVDGEMVYAGYAHTEEAKEKMKQLYSEIKEPDLRRESVKYPYN